MKVDPWAPYSLHDEHGLTSSEAWMLFTLVLHADWKTHVWEGSRNELASLACGVAVKTVRKACERLVDLGLISERDRFRPNGRGRLEVLCYDQVVIPNRGPATFTDGARRWSDSGKAQTGEQGREPEQDADADRAETGQGTSRDRAEIRQIDATHQGKRGPFRSEAVRKVEEETWASVSTVDGQSPKERALAALGAQPDAEWDPDAPPPWSRAQQGER